jgi:hypothetical protein
LSADGGRNGLGSLDLRQEPRTADRRQHAQEFRHAVLSEARQQRCLSDEQFVVDGTLIEAWASRKSYQPKDDPPAPGQGSGRDGQLTEAR